MSRKVYQCNKCFEYSKYHESAERHGLNRINLYTDDNLISNRKVFLRCPHCYELLDTSKTLKDSKSHQALDKVKKDGSEPNLQIIIKAKCIELNLMEYYSLLSSHNLSNEQEINIRVHILVLENNKRREWADEKYEVPYNDNELKNFLELEKLLDLETGEFLVIEIKRYLGKFEEAREQLDLLCSKLKNKVKWYNDKINKEKVRIEYKERYVSRFFLTEIAKNTLKKLRF